MGHSFCAEDSPIPRLTPLVQPTTTATAEVPSPTTTQATAYRPPKRKVRSSGFAHSGAELDIYEFAATREQTALREFLRWETPAATTNDGLLERKDSNRMKKALLGGLFQKGKNAGVKGVTVGRKTSDGKRYFQIVVDEVEMERQRKERDQGTQQAKNREMRIGVEKREEVWTGEEPPAKKNLAQVRSKMNTHHLGTTVEQRVMNSEALPPTRDPVGKTGWGSKTKDKGKTKENINPEEDSPPAGTFRLLPKPDIGSTGRDLASEGSGILARFGVAADTKIDNNSLGLETKGFSQGDIRERQVPNGVWIQGDQNSNQARKLKSQTSGFVSTIDNQWSMPGLSKTTEPSAPGPASKPWPKAAAVVQPGVQDPVHDLKSRPSTTPEVQRTLQCSQDGPTGSWPKDTTPTTPQHSAQSSITQTWPTDVLLVTPQHSAHNSLETKKSPCSTLKHSKAASAFSAHGSSVDDGQSEVGSVEIMNAQSAEIVRAPGVAGFYTRGTAKLSKPGPAPTRALPSLPEGHDGPAGVYGRANGGNPARIGAEPTLERSPVKVQPSSPTGKYRYSPCKTPAPKLLVMPVEPDGTAENQRMLSDSSPNLRGSTLAVHARRKCSLGGEMNAAMLEQAQLQRVRSTNALKGRDLQRHYSNQTNIEAGQPRPHKETDAKSQDVNLLSSARYSPGIPDHPITKETMNVNLTETGPSLRVGSSDQSTTCKMSPIILVSEQVPTIDFASLDRSNHITSGFERSGKCGILQRAHDNSKKSLEATSGSEVKEQSQRENPGMIPEAWPKPRKSGGSNDTTNHVSVSDQHSFTNTKDHESKLEARISALERKNTILLRVVMAVLDESGNLGGASGGDRSSGLSSTSSLYGSRESRLEAKFDAVLSFLQENKRLSSEQ